MTKKYATFLDKGFPPTPLHRPAIAKTILLKASKPCDSPDIETFSVCQSIAHEKKTVNFLWISIHPRQFPQK
jgi:hypothetical protein